ncbi:MAG TPA: argininosuccinate lyase [Drouetiella sp.]
MSTQGKQLPSEASSADHADNSQPSFDQFRRFWQSPEVERILLCADIESSIAHVRMLGETAIVEKQVSADVIAGLEQIRKEMHAGTPVLQRQDVDIHSAIHRRLYDIVGGMADVVRIAKSHNDQIATDIRLWMRDVTLDLYALIIEVRLKLLQLAERDMDVTMPGYTHMQPAVPILLSHWWLANETRLARDFSRLSDFYKRMNVLPLGACQLAGTTQPIDRQMVAEYLNFDGVMENSLDAVSDRDYLIEFASAASLIGVHLSQMSSELLLWSTQEFAFVRLPRSFVFRSQSMPQKRNPELLEILRSRPSVLNGRLTEFLNELKGLTISYSQDLQECLPGLLDVVQNIRFILELTDVLLPAFKFDTVRMQKLANADMTNAGHAIDFLIERDMAPDKASKIVDQILDYCRERSKTLPDLTLNEWLQFSPAFNEDIYNYVTVENAVDKRISYGGTGGVQVQESLQRAFERLSADKKHVDSLTVKRLACQA